MTSYRKRFYDLTLRCQYDPRGKAIANSIEEFLQNNTDDPQNTDCQCLIKSNHHTRVIRLRLNQIPLIIKIFKMRRLRDSLQHSRCGLSEWKNNTEAAKRTIRTPHLYAYFEKRRLGLVKQCGVVMEDIQDYIELRKLVLAGKRTCFDAIPVLKELYCRGVNHIDMSPSNIFLNESDGSFAIIDWQYSSFYPKTNDLSLCMMAAVFLRYTWMLPEDLLWQQWLDELFNRCRPEISIDKLKAAVGIMQTRKLHWTSRLHLDLGGLGLESIWQRPQCSC